MYHFNLLKHEFLVPPLWALPTYHGSPYPEESRLIELVIFIASQAFVIRAKFILSQHIR
jgi:hypothetical protein